MVINNVHIYGIEQGIRGSKFPMAADIARLNAEITETTKRLGACPMGAGEDQFLTGIIVQFDLTFSIKAWGQAERYHFFDFISSQSTMHRIQNFDFDTQYIKYVDPRVVQIMKELRETYNKTHSLDDYLALIYTNPCGFKLTAAMTTNYRQLKTIYHQRRNHKLPEWREFCKVVEELPYFQELVLGRSVPEKCLDAQHQPKEDKRKEMSI